MGQDIDEDEHDLDALTQFQATDVTCYTCEDYLDYCEEVIVVQVVQPLLHDGVKYFYPILDEEGDFTYTPKAFHFMCWEDIWDSLQELVDDLPPMDDPYSAFRCGACGSGIRDGEATLIWTVGEYHVSKRAPNGEHGLYFEGAGEPITTCLYCTLLMNENIAGLWPYVSQQGECADCIQLRCWRYNACGCGCHRFNAQKELTR